MNLRKFDATLFALASLVDKQFLQNVACIPFKDDEHPHANHSYSQQIRSDDESEIDHKNTMHNATIDLYTRIYLMLEKTTETDVFLAIHDRYFFCLALSVCLLVGKNVYLPNMLTSQAIGSLMEDRQAILITDIDGMEEIHGCMTLASFSCNTELKSVVYDAEKIIHKVRQNVVASVFPADAMINFFTSGSSGQPKIIAKPISALILEVSIINNLLCKKSKLNDFCSAIDQNVMHATVSHQHIYGFIFSVLYPLMYHTRINRYTYALWEDIFYHLSEGDMVVSSPSHLGRFPMNIQTSVMPFAIMSSGAALPYIAACETSIIFNCVPFEIYGSTETGGIAYRQQHIAHQYWDTSESTISRLQVSDSPVTPWTPFVHVTLGQNDQGCLKVSSPCLVNCVDENGIESTFQTNDIVTFLDDGSFTLDGRSDNLVKVEGKRISLDEIEKRLIAHQWITQGHAILLDASYRTEIGIVATLTFAGQKALAEGTKRGMTTQLRLYLSTYFEGVFIPKKWRFVENIPTNSQGKVMKDTLVTFFQKEPISC